jgi:hypothetical protein
MFGPFHSSANEWTTKIWETIDNYNFGYERFNIKNQCKHTAHSFSCMIDFDYIMLETRLPAAKHNSHTFSCMIDFDCIMLETRLPAAG